MVQLAFHFNQSRCTGCYTCVVACKNWHGVPAGPANWMRVITIERGKYPFPFVAHLFAACYHCAEPICVSVCPVNAISKRKQDGIVIVDEEMCLGKDYCQSCLEACPYDAPQFGAEEHAKMQKCDLCRDRLVEGKKPICVSSCPTRALDAGPIDEMRAKYGKLREAIGFTFDETLKPSVVFKPALTDVSVIDS